MYGADSVMIMDWAQHYDARFAFQTAALNSCVPQFGGDNELLLTITQHALGYDTTRAQRAGRVERAL